MNKLYYVYILESINNPNNFYTGYTINIKNRIIKHNNGEVSSTSKLKPWRIKNVFSFDSKEKALKFEKYLKSGSGREFARRHF